jgi:hypothetical protein
MNKPVLGMVIGGVLGVLDGLSAWFSPEARVALPTIVLGSTLKGVVTGLLAGVIARRKRSTALGVLAGLLFGGVLSSLAAFGQPGHYLEIVLPGMLLGAIVGFVTQRYPTSAGIEARGAMLAWALAATTLFAADAAGAAQQPPAPDPFAAIAGLVGRWTGTSEGQPGRGMVEREYERALGNRFIRVRNRSTYPPQEKNPRGETHHDEGFFSFDRARKRLVFRQFHVEGFVNQYVEEPSTRAGEVVFTSEAIENIPPGFRARETYILKGPDEVEEIFELAEPGKPFAVYSRARLTRVGR